MIEDPRVRAVLDLPLHRSLGLCLVDPADPSAGVRLEVTAAVANPSGVLHGGIVPLVLDVTCYLALLPHLGDDVGAVTVSTTASIIAAASLGDVVRAQARVDRLGGRQAFLGASLLSQDDRILATGQVVKAVLRPRA